MKLPHHTTASYIPNRRTNVSQESSEGGPRLVVDGKWTGRMDGRRKSHWSSVRVACSCSPPIQPTWCGVDRLWEYCSWLVARSLQSYTIPPGDRTHPTNDPDGGLMLALPEEPREGIAVRHRLNIIPVYITDHVSRKLSARAIQAVELHQHTRQPTP